MAFSSLIFLFFFLPLFLLGYALVPTRFRNLFIVFGGYFFYAWGAPTYAPLLFFTISFDYGVSRLIVNLQEKQKYLYAKGIFLCSILMNIGLLIYFKYSNFFAHQLQALLQWQHLPTFSWQEVILPIGISFTIFQELSYIIDVYRRKSRPAQSLIDFASYLLLFPHLIAGPIVRYLDIENQLRERVFSAENVLKGFQRFSLGLSKKVLIANTLSAVAETIFHLHTIRPLSAPLAWLGILCYAFQIYFDFSGYTDMAIGLAKMLGFDFLENFRHPYIATSITDFWRRWHISLSTWFREYVYIPLGGNRISVPRTYLHLWIVFLISGLWHGANWNFLLWGAFHGFFIMIDKLVWLEWSKRLPRLLTIPLTFAVICIGWVFFRIEDLGSALSYIERLFTFSTWFTPIEVRWAEVLDHRSITTLLITLGLSFLPAFWEKHESSPISAEAPTRRPLRRYLWGIGTACLFVVSIMALVNATFNPFIYFRF